MTDIDIIPTPEDRSADGRPPTVFDVPAPSESAAEGGPSGAAPARDTLIILPVRDTVLFPGTVFPIALGRSVSIAAAQQAVREEKQIGVLMQRDADKGEPAAGDFHSFGTVANVLRYISTPDGHHHVVVQGEQRFQVEEFLHEQPFFRARVRLVVEPEQRSADIEARFINLKRMALEALQLLPQAPSDLIGAVQAAANPSQLTDLVAAYLDFEAASKQELIETIDPVARIDKVTGLLAHRLEVLRITAEIGRQTKATFDERQKEAVLREQMAAIQRQLGEGDAGRVQEVADLSAAIGAAKMPPDAEAAARKELRRYERSSDASPESGMIRNHLDWMVELPWALPDEVPIDIAEARRVLDADHFGLAKIKSRIVEYLAVRKLAPNGRAPILCFVGPPGVGKTSLGQSIARAMGRPFVRVSLGGVHDEAEIRGHRSTYIGAMPGNIIQGLRKAGARNGVMMLTRSTKWGVAWGATRRPPCWRCSTPSRMPPSATTISARPSTCRAWCSSPPPTCSTPSLGRCATAWRSSSSPATLRPRSWRSPTATSSRAKPRPTGSSPATWTCRGMCSER